jgi:metallo-beta-lactamase family protein
VPVYVDSPLAISATEVFKKNTEYFDDEAKKYILGGDNPLDFENLVFTRTTDESKMINKIEGPKIIISASGMCDAGRIKHHLKHNIWKENTTVLFVGYQAPGTLGRRILDGADDVRIFGDTIKVKARVEMIDGFSGHGDMDDLDKFVNNFKKKPKNIFLVHGERDQITAFASRLKDSYGLTSTIPEMGETYELEYSGFEQTTPEANRKITKMSFRRLELINMIKRVKDQISDLSSIISYGDINKMKEKEIEDTIASYLRIEKEITEVLNRIDKSGE